LSSFPSPWRPGAWDPNAPAKASSWSCGRCRCLQSSARPLAGILEQEAPLRHP